jgi:prefoldin subunit 5
MARVSKEAIQILANRIAKLVDNKKEVPVPSKITKLIDGYNTLNQESKELNAKLNSLSAQLSNLGYCMKSSYTNNTTIINWIPKKNSVSSYNEIYNDIILSLEFDKKDLASLEKEIIAKYS